MMMMKGLSWVGFRGQLFFAVTNSESEAYLWKWRHGLEGEAGDSIFADWLVFVSSQQNLGPSKTGVYTHEAEHVQGWPVERQPGNDLFDHREYSS